MTTPAWSAAQNGLPGNLDATNASAQVNQFLGTHGVTPVYQGAVAVAQTGYNGFFWNTPGNSDVAQKFTMSGTAIGRITVPVQPTNNGADLLVTLCPDNAGVPNTAAPIAQTKISAAHLVQLAATTGLPNGGPLATPVNNTQFFTNFAPITSWTTPAGTNGVANSSAVVTSGNYQIFLGGEDPTNAATTAVSTVQYLGGGTIGYPVPQPSLPAPSFYAQATATPTALVYMGGQNSSGTILSAVWTAGWNPNTGVVSSWSTQAALPVGINQGASASWNNTIFLIGGTTTGVTAGAVTTIYTNTVNNGQLGAWTATTPLPQALTYAYAGVVGNWLIVAGGLSSGNVVQSTCYYAPILPDGSLGPFKNGPTLPTPAYTFVPQWATAVTDSSLILFAGLKAVGTNSNWAQVLTVTPTGIANAWSSTQIFNYAGAAVVGAFTDGGGVWYVMTYQQNNTYTTSKLLPVPLVSIPLAATGLSNGSPYWVVLSQYQVATSSDYLSIGIEYQSYATDAVSSARHANSWSGVSGSYSVPLTVYDGSSAGPLLHTVTDVDATSTVVPSWRQWDSFLYNDPGLLIGHIESTLTPNAPLNKNPTFTSGVSPWTVTGGTFVQSNAQTHGGFAFSGLLTPDGVTATVFAQSEKVPVQQGGGPMYGISQWYLADAWLYSTPGYTNVSLSVNWYDRAGTFLSASSNTITLAAATWTHVQNFFEAPATAAQATISATEGGTPTAAKVLYVSNAFLIQSPECVASFTSAATVNYASGSPWPPTGVTQLL